MKLNLYEDMLAEKRMKFYIDIYIHAHIYIFYKRSVMDVLYDISDNMVTHRLQERKKEN